MTNKPALPDRLMAKGMDMVSAACVQYPGSVGKLIVGDRPVRWHATDTHVKTVRQLHTVPGDRRSGFRPVAYASGIALSVKRNTLVAQARDIGGKPAAAFALGTAVLAAELELPSLDDPEDVTTPQLLVATMLIGREALRATLGVHVPQERAFYSANGSVHLLEQGIPIAELAAAYPSAIHL